MSRQRPSSASAVGRTPPSLVFRVPEGASAGTQIEFEKDGQKYRARVPEGVAPGGLFRTVGPKSLEQAVLERALTPGGSGAAAARRARPQSASAAASGQRRSQRPQSASAAAKKKWWEDEVKAKKLQAERDERRLSKFKLGGKPITEREYMMVQEYKRRRDNGEVSDEAYWKQFGFKFSGGQTEISAEAMRDYGYGIPNWSPYNNSKADCLQRTTANGEYGEFTKHQYLKSLATLLAEHGRKSGADMKMLLDPSSKMHCAVAAYKEYE